MSFKKLSIYLVFISCNYDVFGGINLKKEKLDRIGETPLPILNGAKVQVTLPQNPQKKWKNTWKRC